MIARKNFMGQRRILAVKASSMKFFGTGPEFWYNLQANYDLCLAASRAEKDLDMIPQLAHA